MHVYRVRMHLNGIGDFAMGKKVWKITLQWEDFAPAKHQKISQLRSTLATDHQLMI